MRKRPRDQYTLFDTAVSLPNGFVYRPNFLTVREEELLVAEIEQLPLRNAPYREYVAKRRIYGFGWSYEHDRFVPGPPLPAFLRPLTLRIAKWAMIPADTIVEALITEYEPGAGVGWHRDNEPCETVIGISLSGWADMQLRPLASAGDPKEVTRLTLEPRSTYLMQKESRWNFQHRIMPVETLRYSITFRTIKRMAVRDDIGTFHVA